MGPLNVPTLSKKHFFLSQLVLSSGQTFSVAALIVFAQVRMRNQSPFIRWQTAPVCPTVAGLPWGDWPSPQ